MSVKKIVGIETELRLDYADLEQRHLRIREAERQDIEDYELPWRVVDNSLRDSGESNYQPILPQGGDNLRELNNIVFGLEREYPSAGIAIRGHHTMGRKNNQFSRYQRFGFSGGYNLSGFRVYVDGTHPEVSTPECASPRDLVCWQKAGEKIIETGKKKTEEETGYRITLYNDNTDCLGKSWGAHENYLVSNELFETLVEGSNGHGFGRFPTNDIQSFWVTFLVTRFIFCGSGKIGSETNNRYKYQFLISQRAEFMNCLFGHDTMRERPLINLRDISYVSKRFGRRLHVIAGDSNMCEVALYLKVGTAMIMLMMLEDGFVTVGTFPALLKPINQLHVVMADLDCNKLLDVFINGLYKKMTAVDIQKLFYELALRWYIQRHKNEHEPTPWIEDVLSRLDRVLTQLAKDPSDLFGVLDWVTKHRFCTLEIQKQHASLNDINSPKHPLFRRLLGICGGYHRLDDRGFYNSLKDNQDVERVVQDTDIEAACLRPPDDTRAYERSKFLRHFGQSVYCVNWQHIFLNRNPYDIVLNSPYTVPKEHD